MRIQEMLGGDCNVITSVSDANLLNYKPLVGDTDG